MYAPTLLIGLGGLGSSIVQAVHDRVPEDRRASVRVHILDTDVQELKDGRYRQLLATNQVTQISPPITVRRCVERLSDRTRVCDWFPGERLGSASLDNKRIVDGASQIRAISRLALLDSLVEGRLAKLDATLQSLRTATGSNLQQAVRVMIVSSLAGGTGSGCFLQIALYVRDYFAAQLHTDNVVVRGLLVMPEIFVRNGDYQSVDLIANVRANGYASIKELDAVTRQRANQLDPGNNPDAALLAPLELEFKPGSRDSARIEAGPAPLDFAFLYDYTNTAGENLGNKSNYIAQAMDSLYYQLFSPLEGRAGIHSQEDNLILTLVRNQDRARYASSATAKLIYPYQDILDYCALQWASSGLSEDWLEVDRLIRDEFEQIERDKRDGIYLEKPNPHARFVEITTLKAKAENPRPFYRTVYRDAHLIDQQLVPGEAKSTLWLQAVENRLKEAFARVEAAAASSLSALNPDYLKDKDNVVSQVENNERGMEAYRQALIGGMQPLANMIVKEALWEDYQRQQAFDRENELHMNTWLLGKAEAMHPVALRFFLSEAWLAVKASLDDLEGQRGKLEKSIAAYQRQWDDPETEAVETAGMVAAKRASVNAVVEFFKRDLPEFADEYLNAAESHKQAIRQWALVKVKRDAMSLLQAHLHDMLNDWVGFFRQLEAVLGACQRDIKLLADKQADNTDPTRVHVLASAEHKAALWENEGVGLRDKDLPPDIAQQIYLGLYRRRAGRHFDEPQDDGADWAEQLFRKQVVGWCKAELSKSPRLDLNIKAALDKELRLDQAQGRNSGLTAEQVFHARVTQLKALAHPFVPVARESFDFWCMHNEVSAQIGNGLQQQAMGDARVDPAFDRHELVYLNMTYGLMATDLPTLKDALGIYRRAYEDRIALSRETPPKSCTPHLDWRWDSPAYLPEVDDGLQQQAMLDLRRAVIYCLILDTPPVFKGMHDNVGVWQTNPAPGVFANLTGLDGKPVEATVKGLYLGLATQYGLVKTILKLAMETEENGHRQSQPLPIVEKLTASLDVLLNAFTGKFNLAEGERIRNSLVAALFDEVHSRLYHAIGMPGTAQQTAEAHIQSALAASSVINKPDVDPGLVSIVRRLAQDALKLKAD